MKFNWSTGELIKTLKPLGEDKKNQIRAPAPILSFKVDAIGAPPEQRRLQTSSWPFFSRAARDKQERRIRLLHGRAVRRAETTASPGGVWILRRPNQRQQAVDRRRRAAFFGGRARVLESSAVVPRPRAAPIARSAAGASSVSASPPPPPATGRTAPSTAPRRPRRRRCRSEPTAPNHTHPKSCRLLLSPCWLFVLVHPSSQQPQDDRIQAGRCRRCVVQGHFGGWFRVCCMSGYLRRWFILVREVYVLIFPGSPEEKRHESFGVHCSVQLSLLRLFRFTRILYIVTRVTHLSVRNLR